MKTLDPHWSSPDALLAAWLKHLSTHRAHEFDRADHEAVAANPMARCVLLSLAIRAGDYRASPLTPVDIPKPDGARRTLLLPSLTDRLVQGALAQAISDAVEGELHAASHAYRSGRGVESAHRALIERLCRSPAWVWRGDIESFFDSVDHPSLLRRLREMGLVNGTAAPVLRQLLRAEILRRGPVDREAVDRCLCRGLPQGSPLSPVLSNILLNRLDQSLAEQGIEHVRYGDDLVVLSDSKSDVEIATAAVAELLASLRLRLHPGKSATFEPGEPFVFLGRTVNPSAAPLEGIPVPVSTAPPLEAASLSAAQADDSPEAEAASPLLRTLYLVKDQTRLVRDGDSLVVEVHGERVERVPSGRLHQILAFGATSLTSGAIALCLERGIPVMLLSGRGKHFGVIDPMKLPQPALLRAQLDAADDSRARLPIARALVDAKVSNSLLMLRRWARRHESTPIKRAIQRVAESRRRIQRCDNVESLRGMEGAVAAAYFEAMGSLLKPDWRFTGRRRQPPPDPMNSILSYGYTVLYYNVLTLLLARGLQPHIGLFHQARTGHHALASDMMEPFRPIVVDAVAVDLASNGGLDPSQFNWPDHPGEACLMSAEARHKLIHALESKLNMKLLVSDSETRLDMRRVVDMQILGLCDHLLDAKRRFSGFAAR